MAAVCFAEMHSKLKLNKSASANQEVIYGIAKLDREDLSYVLAQGEEPPVLN